MEIDPLQPDPDPVRAFRPFFRNSVAIGGSYSDQNGRFDEFKRIYNTFTKLGINVVHPFSVKRLDKDADFIRLEGDGQEGASDSLTNDELQEDANVRFRYASAAYFVCPGGYLGQHTEEEVYVLTEEAQYYKDEVAIYFSEPPNPWPGSRCREFIQEIAIGRVQTAEYVAAAIVGDSLKYLNLPFSENEIDWSKFQ